MLGEWSTGVHIKRNFNVDRIRSVYKDHLTTFENMSSDPRNSGTYDKLMHKIFSLALYVFLFITFVCVINFFMLFLVLCLVILHPPTRLWGQARLVVSPLILISNCSVC